MNTIDFDDYDAFIKACREAEINAVALRAVNERRAKVEGDKVETSRMQSATLLAYLRGNVLKTVIEGPPAKIQVQLMKDGFSVTRRDEKKT